MFIGTQVARGGNWWYHHGGQLAKVAGTAWTTAGQKLNTLYSHPKMWPSFCLPFLIMKGKKFELVLGLLSNFGGQEGQKVV